MSTTSNAGITFGALLGVATVIIGTVGQVTTTARQRNINFEI